MRCGFAFPHRGRANDMANERRGANENDPAHLSLPNRNRGLKNGVCDSCTSTICAASNKISFQNTHTVIQFFHKNRKTEVHSYLHAITADKKMKMQVGSVEA